MSRPSRSDQADRERECATAAWPAVPASPACAARARACTCAPPRRSAPRTVTTGRARLAVPAPELRRSTPDASCIACTKSSQVTAMPVVALEVEVDAAAEALGAEQRVLHADDLGAFLVDGGRVEVVDLEVLVGAHVVRHRARVLGELLAAQVLDRADALDRARVEVAREFLVAEDGQAFLQRQLEPVAAGDAIAGPVVEILVADRRLRSRRSRRRSRSPDRPAPGGC